MNSLDSLFEKIPILRDIDRRKRTLVAIFMVFMIVSVLGIIIDAIAEAGGAIALTAVAIGFLLMAVIIIADYFMNKKKQPEIPPEPEPYRFFNDSPDGNSFQDDSYDFYDGNSGPPQQDDTDRFHITPPFGEERQDNGGFEVTLPQQEQESFAPDFTSDAAPDFASDFTPDYPPEERVPFRTQPQEEPVFAPEPEPAVRTPFADVPGQPVMSFAHSPALREEVADAANAVAPDIAPPPPQPEIVGGPVMSIPYRGVQNAAVTQPVPAPQPVPQPALQQPVYQAPAAPYQPVYTSPSQPSYPMQNDDRGKEIEQFFDNMSEDELLYSDCVEVWASDAKPAAIRLLKQVESLSDKKMADSLGREAEYINAMLDRIYYFTMLDSVRENLELKEYNFSAVVKECLRRFSPFFMEKRIGLLWKGLDINIISDKRWLVFALTQVVFNAVEFTGLGGKIAISAKKEGSMIHLMVDDNGCGIAEEDLPKIFMAGFMGDNAPNESGRRTGMGLFITRSVVEKLGGSVTAESTLGKGTRVTIILPEKP